MKIQIIDRYLLRQFVQTFSICFLSLVGLFIIFDLFTNLEEFVTCGKKAGGVVGFIANYYMFKTILFFDRTGGVLALTSAMFTVSWIQRNNEMTALMAAGVSRFRVLLPIIIAVGVISLMSMANREILMPRYRNELALAPQDPSGSKPQTFQPRYDSHTDVVLTGKNSYLEEKRIAEPNIRMPTSLSDYGGVFAAENAFYKPADKRHPGGYLLDGVRQPRNLKARPSLRLNGEAVVITPCDADWLEPDQCFLVSDVDFEQLTGKNLTQTSSTFQLIRGLRNSSLGYEAKERVAIHARIVQPLLDMTLLMLGLPLIVSRESRNVFMAMAVCMTVTIAFTLIVAASQSLGEITYGMFTPPLAAWLPLMIFVPMAAWLSENLWK